VDNNELIIEQARELAMLKRELSDEKKMRELYHSLYLREVSGKEAVKANDT
jgi:hypothetical protein